MDNQTPHLLQFVLYSTAELVASDGAGFWSNEQGWVEFKCATKFTVANVSSCNLPLMEGQDAKWIIWEPTAVTGVMSTQRQSQPSLPLAQAH